MVAEMFIEHKHTSQNQKFQGLGRSYYALVQNVILQDRNVKVILEGKKCLSELRH